jgi:hypothetical protein
MNPQKPMVLKEGYSISLVQNNHWVLKHLLPTHFTWALGKCNSNIISNESITRGNRMKLNAFI